MINSELFLKLPQHEKLNSSFFDREMNYFIIFPEPVQSLVLRYLEIFLKIRTHL